MLGGRNNTAADDATSVQGDQGNNADVSRTRQACALILVGLS